LQRNPLDRGGWLFSRVARSLRINLDMLVAPPASDVLRAYPPIAGAKWARLDSSVNLDSMANPDPYYVSIDLPTARHPQMLLATDQNRQPPTVEHGAPLRLPAPMKIGLKNIKAITQITYSV
jgi:DMSO/TMAO reductase YedYZ molybdopterin-dependent catalytic subunit